MKTHTFILAGLMVVAMPGPDFAATNKGSPPHRRSPVLSSSEGFEKKFIRGENEIDQATLAQMPYDAFLAESGYVVYPVEENIPVLQAKVARNPMILRKDFISRRVQVLRRLNARNADDSVKGILGKQFVIVSEIGSVSQFMVEAKDLHFVEGREQAPNIQEQSAITKPESNSP